MSETPIYDECVAHLGDPLAKPGIKGLLPISKPKRKRETSKQ